MRQKTAMRIFTAVLVGSGAFLIGHVYAGSMALTVGIYLLGVGLAVGMDTATTPE